MVDEIEREDDEGWDSWPRLARSTATTGVKPWGGGESAQRKKKISRKEKGRRGEGERVTVSQVSLVRDPDKGSSQSARTIFGGCVLEASMSRNDQRGC